MRKIRKMIFVCSLVVVMSFFMFACSCGETTDDAGGNNNPKEPVLSSIEITKAPSKTEYNEGEKFATAGMEVTAHYTEGKADSVVTNYTYSPNGALAVSDKTVTVSYTEGGVTKTDTVEITVYAASEPVNIELEYGDKTVIEGAADSENSVYKVSGGVLTAVGVGTSVLTVNGKKYNITVNPAEVDVILFTGQSNMVGRETSKYASELEGISFEYKYNSDKLVTTANPVGETFGAVEVSSGSSIVPKFCEDYYEQTGRKTVAVHVARGGRAISYFAQTGAIYPNIVNKYSACIEYLEADENFEIGRKFYVMFQGESDTEALSKQTYKDTYMNFHSGVKNELGFEFGALIQTGRNTNISYPGIVRIAQAKTELAYENEDIIMINKFGIDCFAKHKEYMRSDNVHYNSEGLQKIAAGSCKALIDYLGYGEKSVEGVDPVTYLADPTEVTGVSFAETSKQLKVGTTAYLALNFTGSSGMFSEGDNYEPVNSAVKWSSSVPSVATVDKGFVTAVGEGETVITATSLADESLSATMTLTVTEQGSSSGTSLVYRWDFETDMAEANEKILLTRQGAEWSKPTINESYNYSDANQNLYWTLSENLTLPADTDWTFSWKGTCAQLTDGTGKHSAAILLSGEGDQFITYQVKNGIYVRNKMTSKDHKAMFNGASVMNAMYSENTWELAYHAAQNKIELFLNGVSQGTLDWTVDIVVNTMFGRAKDSLHFIGSIDWMEITVGEQAEEPAPVDVTEYVWNFESDASEENGLVTTTYGGTVEPTFENGSYNYDSETQAYYSLSKDIVLSKDKDWSFEWKGKCDTLSKSGHSAAILISGTDNQFITYQVERGIYVRNGKDGDYQVRFGEIDNTLLPHQYEDNTWKVAYDADTNVLSLYLNGELKQTASWSVDLVINSILGREDDDLHMIGSVDWMKITVEN